MTRGNDPAVHSVVLDEGRVVAFECTAGSWADCRNYPACECESWDASHFSEPTAGHEPVPHDQCWMKYWVEESDAPDDLPSEVTGRFPITASWEFDYLAWEIA